MSSSCPCATTRLANKNNEVAKEKAEWVREQLEANPACFPKGCGSVVWSLEESDGKAKMGKKECPPK